MNLTITAIKKSLQNWTATSSVRATKLPDLRNAGLALKVVIITCGLVVAVSIFQADTPKAWVNIIIFNLTHLSPLLLFLILLVMLLRHFYPKLSANLVELFTYVIGIIISNLYFNGLFFSDIAIKSAATPWFLTLKITLVTATLISIIFMFLYFVSLSLSPASTEAKLQSLTYRIRPHFLFNSLNAILALIRRDTRKAEYALEELAELFRWLLKDTAQYITIQKEIDIVQQFISIEKIRLGDRLLIEWSIDAEAQNAIIPALTLQPLLENAIYHGVESMNSECPIIVQIAMELGIVTIFVSNPYDPNYRRRKGNGIALSTIKKRLELCFDLEFKVITETEDNLYKTSLSFPFRTDFALTSH